MWELGQILYSDSEVPCPNFEQKWYMCKSKQSFIINGKKDVFYLEFVLLGVSRACYLHFPLCLKPVKSS